MYSIVQAIALGTFRVGMICWDAAAGMELHLPSFHCAALTLQAGLVQLRIVQICCLNMLC